MVEVFRTNIRTEKEADFILEELQKAFPDCDIEFDEEDSAFSFSDDFNVRNIDGTTILTKITFTYSTTP